MSADEERERRKHAGRSHGPAAPTDHRQSPSPPRFTAKEKGKGRAGRQSVAEDGDEGENDDGDRMVDEDSEEDQGMQYVSGPLSSEARNEAIALGKKTEVAFKALGKKYRKSPRTMMVAGGLAVQSTRQNNLSNMFRKWYSATHLGVDGGGYLLCLFLISYNS